MGPRGLLSLASFLATAGGQGCTRRPNSKSRCPRQQPSPRKASPRQVLPIDGPVIRSHPTSRGCSAPTPLPCPSSSSVRCSGGKRSTDRRRIGCCASACVNSGLTRRPEPASPSGWRHAHHWGLGTICQPACEEDACKERRGKGRSGRPVSKNALIFARCAARTRRGHLGGPAALHLSFVLAVRPAQTSSSLRGIATASGGPSAEGPYSVGGMRKKAFRRTTIGFFLASLGVSAGGCPAGPRLAPNGLRETIIRMCPTRSVSTLHRLKRAGSFPSIGRCHVIEREPLTKAAPGV